MRVAILDGTGLLVADITQVDDVGDIAAIGGILCPDDVNIGWAYDPVTQLFSIPAGSPFDPAAGVPTPLTSSLISVMRESSPIAPSKTFPVKVSADFDDHDADVYGDAAITEEGLQLVACETPDAMKQRLALGIYKQFGDYNGGISYAGTGVKWRIYGAIEATSGTSYGMYVDALIPDVTTAHFGCIMNLKFGAAPAHTQVFAYSAAILSIGVSAIDKVYGYHASPSLAVGLSLNVGYSGSIPDGVGNWNLYMTGTAPNKLAGRLDADGGVSIGGGPTIAKVLTATASLDFPSIAAASYQDLTITVTGAKINDSVALGLPAAPTAGIVYSAFVSAANVVKVRATNITAAAIDPAAATVRVTVFDF